MESLSNFFLKILFSCLYSHVLYFIIFVTFFVMNHHEKIARVHRIDALLSAISRRSALWSIDIFGYLIRDKSYMLNVVFGNSISVVLEWFFVPLCELLGLCLCNSVSMILKGFLIPSCDLCEHCIQLLRRCQEFSADMFIICLMTLVSRLLL